MASASPASVTPPQEAGPTNIIKMFTTYTNLLAEATVPEEKKLKAAQEISENFESIVQSSSYSAFLEHSIPRFLKYLKEGEPQFVSEVPTQQLRKLLLEILHRIPTNEHLRPHFQPILSLMFYLLEIENEENVLVCLRIIIELHKQFRPPLQSEIQHFLQFVKTIYQDLPTNVKQFFDVVPISATGFLPPESNATSTPTAATPGISGGTASSSSSLNTSDVGSGTSGQQMTIPKAVNSLKVLAELPIIVVLMYQLYKQNVHSVVADFIPLIMNTIILQPSLPARKSPTFNKEVYVDFVAAQIKTVSFLAYIIRIYQDMVNTYSQNMVGGMLGLLRYCPQEVAHLRKELLIAARHILATDLRNSWTTNESLRPLAYSTLADLVHHVRTHLPLPHLSLAVHMFSKNVHDDSLLVSIQTMSCKLLLNLVECIRQKSDEQGTGREILMRMLEVFVRKFQSIAKHHVPAIFNRCPQMSELQAQQQSTASSSVMPPSVSSSTVPERNSMPSTSTGPSSTSTAPSGELQSLEKRDQDQAKKTTASSPAGPSPTNTFSVPDCRSMVKTLVCGVKTITWGAGSCKVSGTDVNAPTSTQTSKTFLPWETHLFTRLLKYALQALDIYQVSVNPQTGQYYLRPPSSQQVRMKEEKEILEHFAGVFTMMNTSTFKEVFTASIEYLVERIHTNYALQIIPNSFLANPNTSATFATILVRFLLDRLDEMGTNMERSNLYLKLFKLVFGSVSLFASENEQMLKPHLHEIVNRSMELACTSKEPYNYFLLLRALFRSIGGGSHDLLYQEFLPLLPNLLQGLNNLQSGIHRQYMKDLFVELCLTVPVRLSSLLPYLPMLMDPLVSALNGSQTLVSQGLRTLELCVDNLQPDFLYDHIQPVRAELFQALWKTLRNPHDSIAHVAFRVLGKFGGGNRRMLKEPQKLKYNNAETLGPCLLIFYPENTNPISLPVTSVIERALTVLKTLPPNMAALPQQSPMQIDHTVFYRKQAWLVVKSFLIAMMSLEDTESMFYEALSDQSFKTGSPPIVNKTAVPPCPDEPSKKVFEQGITGALLSGTIKELKSEAVPFVSHLVRHCTIIGVVQQAGPCPIKPQARNRRGMDVHALIDAIAAVMAMEDKEFYKVGELAVAVMIETATAITGNAYKAARLPLFEYLSEKLCGCCYERAWFAKNGGCTAIDFLMKRMPVQWVIEHQLNFINALCFVMMDLTNEVSSGTVDSAKQTLEALLRQCNVAQPHEEPHVKSVREKVLPTVTQHLVREIVSPNETTRKQAQHCVSVLAEISGVSIYSFMLPHKSILEDMIPPKKHLLRHQPVKTQIALMDGNTFCTAMSPRLFTMDLAVMEHKIFFTELHSLCEADDSQLLKLPCYKTVQSLTPLRKSALSTEFSNSRHTGSGKRLHEKVDMEVVHMSIRPLLLKLGDYRSLNLQLIQRLSHLMELFPGSFNEKLCEQLLAHLKKWVEVITTGSAAKTNHSSEEIGSPLRAPLLKFLIRYPANTVDYFLLQLSGSQMNRLFMESSTPLRQTLEAHSLKLVNSTFSIPQPPSDQVQAVQKKMELQNQGIKIIRLLVKFNDSWLPEHPVLIGHLRRIWVSSSFQERLKKDGTPIHRWREPKLLAKCLLNYIKHKPSEVELLFQLLLVFTIRHVPDFHFLRKFLDESVAKALQYVLIPMFQVSFERGEGNALIGGPPSPEHDSNDNVISVFIGKVIDPDNPFGTSDAVRILLLQRQGMKLRRLMTFAWPCLLPKQCVDPSTKYTGHLLLAHIIAKFGIHKRIVLQVFHSLLKAHAVEARGVVRQAQDILTPSVPARMEDGNAMLTHWTKKIIVEEGYTFSQLVHMLTLLVRHYRVYYPVRIHLIQHMISAMQRLGFTANQSFEHRKLAVDLAEVILKWELQRIKDDQEQPTNTESTVRGAVHESQIKSPLEKYHADAVVNFLLRIACQVNEPSTTVGSPGETLSRRCVALLKTALRPDVWPGTDLRVGWLDKILVTVVIRAIHTLLARLVTLFPLETGTAPSKYEELETLYANVGKVIFEGLTNYERSQNGATSIFYGPLMMLKAACMHNPSYIDRLMTPFFKALQKMHKDHVTAILGEGATDMLILCLELVRGRLGVMSADVRKLFFFILTTLIEKSPDVKLLRAITKIVEDWIKTKLTQLTMQRLPTLREKSLLLVRMMYNFEKRFPEEFELQAQFLELVNYVYRDENLVNTELASKLEAAFLSGLRCIQPQIRSRFMEVFDKSMKKKLYDRLLYIFCSQNWEAMGPHFWIKQCIELLLAVSACERPVTPSSTFSMLPSVTSFIRASDNQVCKTILAHAQQRAAVSAEELEGEKMQIDGGTPEEEQDDSSLCLFEIEDAEKLMKALDRESGTNPLKKADALKLLAKRHGKFVQKLREVKTASFLGPMAQLCHRYSNLAHTVWVDLFPQLWNLLTDKQQQVLAGEISPFMCSGSHLVQVGTFPSSVHTILEGVSKCTPSVPIRPCILKYLGKTHNSWHRSGLMLEDYASLCEEYSNNQISHQQQQVVDFSPFEEDPSEINQHETLDALAEMYSLLNEEDMWAGLWQQRCRYPETATAIAYETQGFYEQAQSTYELVMSKAREEHNRSPANPQLTSEYNLWEQHWISCSKELGQWDLLTEFGKTKGHTNPFLVLESAWRVPEWQSMKDALAQVEVDFPDSIAYKLNLYRGYIAICHQDDQHLNLVDRHVEHSTVQAIRQWRRLPPVISQQHIPLLQAAQQIMELQEAASIHTGLQPANVGRSTSLHDMKAVVKTWRNRLPMPSDNLSHWSDIFMWRHHHYQAIVAAYENQSQHEAQSNHSMLGVHASAWAIIHYGYIARKQSLTGVCLDSLSRIHTIPSVPIVDCFQKIKQQVKCYLQMAGGMAKQELQEGLELIESTNLKYFSKEMTAEFFALKGMFLAHIGRSEDANKAFSQAVQMHDSLVMAWALWGDYLDGLFVLESHRNMQLGVSAVVCYLHACRHQNEAKCRKYLARTIWLMTYDDEKGSISEAVDKYCVGVPAVHWLPWYVPETFLLLLPPGGIPQLLTCLMRREGQKILNLLCTIGRVHPQAMYFPIRTLYLTWKIEQRERHKMEAAAAGVSGQRLSTSGSNVPIAADMQNATSGSSKTNTTGSETGQTGVAGSSNVKATVSSTPAASAAVENLPIATTAPTTPTSASKTAEKTLTSTADTAASPATSSTSGAASTPQTTGTGSGASQSDPGAIRATAQMWRCSKIMHLLRDLHPTLLSALEGVVDQMVWFRECWHEEVLRQLRQGLAKCYQVAFETRGDVTGARITPHTLSFVKKLVSTFGIGFESASSVSSTLSSAASESLAKRAQATAQDPVFQRLKEQFAVDFDFSQPGSMGLHSLIAKLKKWIKTLEEKAKLLPNSFLLEERCRFLSNFTTSTAEVELPGEFLMPKANTHSPYYIRIARFMPRVELVQKHNFSARRLYIRGNNGKIYPYLVVNDACMTESRREERILQLLRLLNLYLEKRKESCKRHLLFTVPRVVAVSPQMRLIEDNPSFISLREILTECCSKKHVESDAPVALYYERLAAVQSRGCQVTHQVLKDILRDVQLSLVPEILLKEWAQYTYQDPSDYWTFRKQLSIQMALSGFAEFTLHLTRLGPEMLQIAQDSGRLTVSYSELDANRPVPFRLTPNIAEFVTPVGVNGVMTAAIVSAARCLAEPHFGVQSILRAVLRDEMIAWHKKKQDETHSLPLSNPPTDMDSELLIRLVKGAVSAIMTRLQSKLFTCRIFQMTESSTVFLHSYLCSLHRPCSV
ncbi:Transformation/transcription domain-associated protein [Acropora cervicornis]|uniref:Transformation/transcription domain-associated protein n=1 Tax=Acropora cervicornis TaxID=6130 RepID=A0AAD9V8M7_ACRCE|nr:Transformation/transcription domain-associated protein [Acropora cervicornis]